MAATGFTPEEFCLLVNPETGKQIKSYKIDSRRAVIQRQGVVRSRARIDLWSCILIMECDTDFLMPDQMLELLNLGGKIAGVGDFGPRSGGEFGRFTAEIVK